MKLQEMLLKDFLNSCDLVKFAKYGPNPEEIANSFILNPEGKKINQKIDGRGRAREDKQPNSLIVYLFMNFQRPLKELYGIQKEEIDIYNKLLLIDAEHVSAMLLSSFRLEQIHLLLEITFNVDDEALKEDEAEDISF